MGIGGRRCSEWRAEPPEPSRFGRGEVVVEPGAAQRAPEVLARAGCRVDEFDVGGSCSEQVFDGAGSEEGQGGDVGRRVSEGDEQRHLVGDPFTQMDVRGFQKGANTLTGPVVGFTVSTWPVVAGEALVARPVSGYQSLELHPASLAAFEGGYFPLCESA